MTDRQGVLLGIDAGGTYVKAAAFDLDEGTSSTSTQAVGMEHPAAGHNERDPEALWTATCRVIRAALAGLPDGASRIHALTVTGHGNGAYFVDAAGRPTHPAIQASDTRASDLVAGWVRSGIVDDLRSEVWNDLWPGQPGPILAWFAQHDPATLERAAALLMCTDYLRARLTGSVAAELTAWSCNGLVDSRRRTISTRALEALGVAGHERLLPELVDHDTIAGYVTREASELTGVPAGLPVPAGAVDNVALHVGAGVLDGRRIVVGAGTWSINQLLVPLAAMRIDGPLGQAAPTAACLAIPDGMAMLIDASATSASTLGWAIERALRGLEHDALINDQNAFGYTLERIAERGSPPDAPMFVPYLDGSRGHSTSRGAWIGLSSAHDEIDLARATVEGVCLEHRRHVERLARATSTASPLRLAGGASRSAVWSQMFADVMNRPVEVSPVEEQGAVGAAVIGGSVVGSFSSLQDGLDHLNPSWEVYEPDPDRAGAAEARYARYLRWASLVESEPWT